MVASLPTFPLPTAAYRASIDRVLKLQENNAGVRDTQDTRLSYRESSEQGSGYCRRRQERLSNQVPCWAAQNPASKSPPGGQMLTQHSWPVLPLPFTWQPRPEETKKEGRLMEDLEPSQLERGRNWPWCPQGHGEEGRGKGTPTASQP